jgi:hypothetical protein|tara:strand:+ start:403 stop:558 length:156 start_codon:yes stop_codon:yes gene_type:complete
MILTVASLEGVTVRCSELVGDLKEMEVLEYTTLVDVMDALTPALSILSLKE